ncbi:MAG: hypothetical protein KI791_13710 [Cyclobacteriaceae bacterium]|nr:hypothetical protein [Cyclobacteriaceae bacterium SS2]
MSWIFILSLIFGTITPQTRTGLHKVEVLSSKLIIHGKTNVNKFDCELVQLMDTETLRVTSEVTDFKLDFDGLVLKFGISQFDCGHEIMNKDFRSILKSEKHPFLFLKINEIYIKEETSLMEKLDVSSFVTISLAGVEQTKMIEKATVINHDDQLVTFKGSRVLQMTDFKIEPPTKFLGLVSVENELEVSFEIRMKTVPIK